MKELCPKAKVCVKEKIMWQEFIYEDLLNACNRLGELGF